MTATLPVEVADVESTGPFTFRWPENVESFELGWTYTARVGGQTFRVKHGLGERGVYGQPRVHSVTWLGGEVQVEGVATDDYARSRDLLSMLKIAGKKHVQLAEDIPQGYDGFEIVVHRSLIDAKGSPRGLAVRIKEDDLAAWALHAILRARDKGNAKPTIRPRKVLSSPAAAYRPLDRDAKVRVVASLAELAQHLEGAQMTFTSDPDADAFVREGGFAFLVGVIADQGIVAERAWALPHLLRSRLGHLDPVHIAEQPDAVHAAFEQPPSLHRFNPTVSRWVVRAAEQVLSRYDGDAERIWSDSPTVVELIRRLEAFDGIAQKKAAMAVEILARDLKRTITNFEGSDIAYDVHVRRVMMRTGLAERDEVSHMVGVARDLYPERPGLLDLPLWHVGRSWCNARVPDCHACALESVCPKFIARGDVVKGV